MSSYAVLVRNGGGVARRLNFRKSLVLSLVVIRSANLERAKAFYSLLGVQLQVEKHGNGPEHLAAAIGGTVFEVYPRGNEPATTGVRLGFRVQSVESTLAALEGVRIVSPLSAGPWGLRAVVVDPDGHRVEFVQAD
jgi:lactoylglutathione lyase